ncbi:unnamed protein product [Durusdinium trenchii]|uniref:Endonuclease/exonuclease/phosphatase domain-containing protein n=1 Tax=Durusdinium trenchii TaxID=1381693 RepID=A0ABP0LUJ1_9DINO
MCRCSSALKLGSRYLVHCLVGKFLAWFTPAVPGPSEHESWPDLMAPGFWRSTEDFKEYLCGISEMAFIMSSDPHLRLPRTLRDLCLIGSNLPLGEMESSAFGYIASLTLIATVFFWCPDGHRGPMDRERGEAPEARASTQKLRETLLNPLVVTNVEDEDLRGSKLNSTAGLISASAWHREEALVTGRGAWQGQGEEESREGADVASGPDLGSGSSPMTWFQLALALTWSTDAPHRQDVAQQASPRECRANAREKRSTPKQAYHYVCPRCNTHVRSTVRTGRVDHRGFGTWPLALTGVWQLSCDMVPAGPSPDVAPAAAMALGSGSSPVTWFQLALALTWPHGSGCYPDLAEGLGRFGEERSAAVATLRWGQEPFTVVSTHLDPFAEMRGFFQMAEGEVIRLLEFEALHEALGPTKNVAILGDFNTPSQRTATLTEEHRRQAELLDHLSQQRDPKALRHFLPRDSPRIPEEMTALGFAEKLGYRHAWQALDVPHAPYYSHWSGQLIDHCLLKTHRRLRVTYVGVYHDSASDHLPLVIDFELV